MSIETFYTMPSLLSTISPSTDIVLDRAMYCCVLLLSAVIDYSLRYLILTLLPGQMPLSMPMAILLLLLRRHLPIPLGAAFQPAQMRALPWNDHLEGVADDCVIVL